MTAYNPLQKYFRQPKIYMSLPSKGLYYPPGSLKGDYTNVPIFAMTGQDELILKTPDALYNGEATVNVIQSCCPYIADAKQMPNIDVDAVLTGIRIATYGENLPIYHVCEHCGAENDFDVKLPDLLDFYNSLKFTNKVQVGELTITIRPLTYAEMTEFNIENFKIRKTIFQLAQAEDPDQSQIDQLFVAMADIQSSLLLTSIESVQAPDGIVNDPAFITEWVANSEKDLYDAIKEVLSKNKDNWTVTKQTGQCGSCQKENKFDVVLDQSNFFVQ